MRWTYYVNDMEKAADHPFAAKDEQERLRVAGEWMIRRLLHVIDGNKSNAFIVLIDHNEFFQSCACATGAWLQPVNAGFYRIRLRVIRSATLVFMSVAKRTSRLVDNARKLAILFDNRNAGYPMRSLKLHHFGKVAVGAMVIGLNHHARFKTLHLPHMFGLHIRLKVFVNDPKPARLRHGNGEL